MRLRDLSQSRTCRRHDRPRSQRSGCDPRLRIRADPAGPGPARAVDPRAERGHHSRVSRVSSHAEDRRADSRYVAQPGHLLGADARRGEEPAVVSQVGSEGRRLPAVADAVLPGPSHTAGSRGCCQLPAHTEGLEMTRSRFGTWKLTVGSVLVALAAAVATLAAQQPVTSARIQACLLY